MRSPDPRKAASAPSEVSKALKLCMPAFTGVGLFSVVINLLALTGSIYMLQVYDRVLSSRSVPTLVGLSLIVLACFVLQGALDGLRSRMLSRIGARFDELLAPRAFQLVTISPFKGTGKAGEGLQPIRDVDQVRSFLSGVGPTALFDMPFMPIFFIGCFLLHPWLGYFALAGGVIIILITLATEARSREPAKDITKSGAERQQFLEASRRNAESLNALGMTRTFAERFRESNGRHVADALRATDITTGAGAFAKVFRLVLQSGMLGLGAYLVIRGELTGGGMIAASILMSRALAPIEIAVAHWRSFVAARQSYHRLKATLSAFAREDIALKLPAPAKSLTVEGLIVAAPGRTAPILQGITFDLKAGQGLGLIGPSASGKSTLARALVGVWPPLRGEIRLDGAELSQWNRDEIGRHIGYLPQDVELFEGTVAENIARFDPNASSERIIAAAETAGAHEMILRLPDGYETRIGESGTVLSGGQRQRVGLARALYGDPFLVVLDEPNASLDQEGDVALSRAVRSVRDRGGIVVMVTHRPQALAEIDRVAVVVEGKISKIGPRDEVLQGMIRRPGAPPRPAAASPSAGAAAAPVVTITPQLSSLAPAGSRPAAEPAATPSDPIPLRKAANQE